MVELVCKIIMKKGFFNVVQHMLTEDKFRELLHANVWKDIRNA
jgi:hypothetical protein